MPSLKFKFSITGTLPAFQLFVLMVGAFHLILSVVSALTVAHPAPMGPNPACCQLFMGEGWKASKAEFGGLILVVNIFAYRPERIFLASLDASRIIDLTAK
jgi:hypothetical protein